MNTDEHGYGDGEKDATATATATAFLPRITQIVTATVTPRKVGDRVKIEFRRDGEYKMIMVRLGAVPNDLTSSRRRLPRKDKPRTPPVKKKAA
jgi:hypothetical protein